MKSTPTWLFLMALIAGMFATRLLPAQPATIAPKNPATGDKPSLDERLKAILNEPESPPDVTPPQPGTDDPLKKPTDWRRWDLDRDEAKEYADYSAACKREGKNAISREEWKNLNDNERPKALPDELYRHLYPSGGQTALSCLKKKKKRGLKLPPPVKIRVIRPQTDRLIALAKVEVSVKSTGRVIRSGMTGRIGEPYNAEAAQHHLAPAEKGDLVVTARTYDASASTNMKYSPKDGVWRQVDEKGRIMFYEYDSEEKDWRKVVQIAERNWEIYLFDRDKEAWQLVGRYEQSRLGNTQCWRLGLFDRPNNRWWTKAFFVPEMLTGQPIAWEPVWVFNEKKRCWLEDDKKETKNWQLPSIKLEQQPIRVLVRSAQGRSAPRAGLASAGKCGCGR